MEADPVDEDQEANTGSIHSFPQRRRRRLILNFSREQEEPVYSGGEGLEQLARLNRGEEPVDIEFVPHAQATTVGFQSLDEVDLTQVFEVPVLVMKNPEVCVRRVSWSTQVEFAGDSTRLCGEQRCGSAWVEVVLPLAKVAPLPATSWRSDTKRQIARTSGTSLLLSSLEATTSRRKRRRQIDDMASRVFRALGLANFEELSRARQALEGDPGNLYAENLLT